MLTPPTPPAPPDDVPEVTEPKRSEAVFVLDRLTQQPTGWLRETSFWFEGDEFWYGLHAPKAHTAEDARRVLYGEQPTKELRELFLRDVRLDMTRPH